MCRITRFPKFDQGQVPARIGGSKVVLDFEVDYSFQIHLFL